MRGIAILAAILWAVASPGMAQQPQAQQGGCASGFCSMSNAPPAEQAADIDDVEAEMKRQMNRQSAPQQSPGAGGGMMCPCMRMMTQMMQGGHMNMMRGMKPPAN